MGMPNSGPPQETTIYHFSHSHPLKLINLDLLPFQHTQNFASCNCAGCESSPSGLIYSCTICTFILHKKCFEMPKKITHPCHNPHSFTLLPKPAYASGQFKCDACADIGSGFSYHCQPCGIDLHILCAVMPLSTTHAFHAHKLHLTFEAPYSSKSFCCDICKINDFNRSWLYRCTSCGFDAHLNCARAPPPPMQNMARSAPQPPPQFPGPTAYTLTPSPMMSNPPFGIPVGGPVVNPALEINRQNEMVLQAIRQMINNNNAIAQQYLGGRGGFGGNNGMQQLMQMISGMNNGGVGGGGIPDFSGLGGGGGGTDFLQSLMSGGGFNGLDLLGGGGFGGVLGGFGFF